MERLVGTFIVIVIFAAAGAFGGYEYAMKSEEAAVPAAPVAAAPEGDPVVQVQATPAKSGTIEETLAAYGTVVAAPGEIRTFSVPYESRVSKVVVTDGQEVAAGTELMEIEPSPDARLALDQAVRDRDAARDQLDLLKQQADLKLATHQDLLQAQQRLQSAELNLKSLKDRGIDDLQIIKAASPGIVSKIAAGEGQIIPAGATLLETIGRDQITVRLGFESTDVECLRIGQPVHIASVNSSNEKTVKGTVEMISQKVNPDTRLVDVYVTPSSNAHLLLDEYVQGKVAITSQKGLIVPQKSVLPDGNNNILYTIDHNKATRHVVRLGLESKQQLQVFCDDLTAGQQVVVTGNSQLSDGMQVQMGAAE